MFRIHSVRLLFCYFMYFSYSSMFQWFHKAFGNLGFMYCTVLLFHNVNLRAYFIHLRGKNLVSVSFEPVSFLHKISNLFIFPSKFKLYNCNLHEINLKCEKKCKIMFDFSLYNFFYTVWNSIVWIKCWTTDWDRTMQMLTHQVRNRREKKIMNESSNNKKITSYN